MNIFTSILLLFSFSFSVLFTNTEELRSSNDGKIVVRKIKTQTIVEYTLDASVSEVINQALQDANINPYENWEYYKNPARDILLHHLPQDLIDIILQMKNDNNPAVLVVHNFPVDKYIPQTPRNGDCPPSKFEDAVNGKGFVSEICLLGLCSLLGAHPDFDENEKDGTYIHQIIPRDDEKSKNEISSYGSALAFSPHTENVYQEPALKFFSLIGLRGDIKVDTSVILLDDILNYLKNHLPEEKSYEWFLEQMAKNYIQKTGPTFGKNQTSILAPILTLSETGERKFKFNTTNNRTEGCDEDTLFVSEFIKNMLLSEDFKEQCFTNFNLKKGTLLLFNNWEVMHGRCGFKIDYDNWRWLQRCYFALDKE